MRAASADHCEDGPRTMRREARLPAALELNARIRAQGASRRMRAANAGSTAAGGGSRPMNRRLPGALCWSTPTGAFDGELADSYCSPDTS